MAGGMRIAPNGRERPGTRLGNALLDALAPADLDALIPSLRRVLLSREHVLARPGETIDYLHFPVDAFCWTCMDTTGTERPTTVFTAGRRGLPELSRALGVPTAETQIEVLSAGSAWRLPAELLDRPSASVAAPLKTVIMRYAHLVIAMIASRLACNAEHNVDQRLARWLLWMTDETARSELMVTHQQIADLSAIRRPSVSLALSAFQREGIVRSQHGRLRVLDRTHLEELACACYWNRRQAMEIPLESNEGGS